MNRLLILILVVAFSAVAASAAELEITPFATFNQSPLVQIYGFPIDTGADIIPVKELKIYLNQDISSNYTTATNRAKREEVTLDGETYRTTLLARYGIAPKFEVGLSIPYVSHGGGFLDNLIINWHDTFGMPQGGREVATKNQLNYNYKKNGTQKLQMDRSNSGLGDISLTSGFNVYDKNDGDYQNRLTIKSSIKLPTGDSSYLLGSGSTDFAIQLCGSINRYDNIGTIGIYGSVGLLAMSKSDVLSDQHKPVAALGTVGVAWGATPWLLLKTQFNANSSLYSDSSLNEISKSAVMTVFGGTLKFPGEYLLDIGVAEDISVSTAPDVSFHVGLSKKF